MPYKIERRSEKFCVVKKATGENRGCSDTLELAKKHLAALYVHESRVAERRLILAAQAYTPREELWGGRSYLAVPVIGLVEGVIHALNSSLGPEFVPASVFQDAVERWDGKPVFEGHPLFNGRPILGDVPGVREHAVGMVKNPRVTDKKLTMEAWLDTVACGERAPDLLARAMGGEPIEISVGVLAATEKTNGHHQGRDYFGQWSSIDPDHLALLPAGVLGACNQSMGCGVRAAQDADRSDDDSLVCYYHESNLRIAKEGSLNVDHMYAAWLEDGSEKLIRDLRNIPQSVRDKMSESDFAGPNRSFPIQTPEDVFAAAHSLGRAKGDRNAIKRRIIAIAYRKGDGFVARLPEDWKKSADVKVASSLRTFIQAARQFFAAQNADEMGVKDLNRKLTEAIQEKEPGLSVNVRDVFPVIDPSHVVYSCYNPAMDSDSNYGLFERSFDLSTSGVVTVNDLKVEVEVVTSYEPVEGASPSALEQNKGMGAPSSIDQSAPEELTMTKSEKLTKFLEIATECQVKALEAFVEGGAKPVEPVKLPTDAELKAAADARAKETQAAVEAGIAADRTARAAAEQKAATVKTLMAYKDQPFKQAELEAKSQVELDSMVTFAAKVAPAPPKEIKAAIDFGGQGAPRVENDQKDVADPPDVGERLRAMAAKK